MRRQPDVCLELAGVVAEPGLQAHVGRGCGELDVRLVGRRRGIADHGREARATQTRARRLRSRRAYRRSGTTRPGPGARTSRTRAARRAFGSVLTHRLNAGVERHAQRRRAFRSWIPGSGVAELEVAGPPGRIGGERSVELARSPDRLARSSGRGSRRRSRPSGTGWPRRAQLKSSSVALLAPSTISPLVCPSAVVPSRDCARMSTSSSSCRCCS